MAFFDEHAVAKGYAEDRPYLHPEIIQKIKAQMKLTHKVRHALDIGFGCGAGLSTLALTDIAEHVIGVDSSEAMINSAIQDERIEYFNYPAEYLPFTTQKFDLMTLAGAINWVNRRQFFAEAKKILQENGIIVIYDIYILGMMEENDHFESWYHNDYLKRYPKPPRDESPITNEDAEEYGIVQIATENYTSKVKFTLEKYIRYMFTQSNITVALKKQEETCDQIKEWFTSTLSQFFQNDEKNLLFGGYIWYFANKT